MLLILNITEKAWHEGIEGEECGQEWKNERGKSCTIMVSPRVWIEVGGKVQGHQDEIGIVKYLY